MRINDLVRYGFPVRFIECWRNSGLEFLLPLQAEAIQSFDLLQGKSLLISGPTSSGKTLCGELAAIRAVTFNKKAIILAPLKAIASEKYRELKKRYRRAGIRIIVVTSDYPENKRLFEKGDYDLAVMVYEMFNALTVTSLSALEVVGAVVFDEFQLVTSSDRGQAYEVAVSKVVNYPTKIQIVGLIGGLNDCELLSKWLDIPLLKSTNRPVELHQGVLFNGKFAFKRYNDCFEGIEYFTARNSSDCEILERNSISDELFRGIKYLTDRSEQTLVFVSTRNASINLALGLSEYLSLPSAENVIAEFEDIPDTIQKKQLIDCLKKGIGFHNADLSKTYRKFLEGGFRSGEIRVLIATTTLAMGVNLPSRNVFLEAVKYYDGYDGKAVLCPLVMYDYNQIAGRAGRLGQTDDFGRAIIIADDETRKERIWDSYIYGSANINVQSFDIEKLAGILLKLVACRLVKNHDDARALLAKSLRGYYEGFEDKAPSAVIEFLEKFDFIRVVGCRLSCTELGIATSGHNIELDSAVRIRDNFIELNLKDEFLSWLYALTELPEVQGYSLPGWKTTGINNEIQEDIISALVKYNETPAGSLADIVNRNIDETQIRRLRTFRLLVEILEPVAAISLERKYNIGWGRIKHIGEYYSNFLRAVVDIGGATYLNNTQKRNLLRYADCLYYGVPIDCLNLAHLKVSLLERDFLLRLADSGLTVPADIINSGFDVVSSIIPHRVADALYKKCLSLHKDCPDKDETEGNCGKIKIRAKKNGSRYEVTINDFNVTLQPRLYSYLHKLFNVVDKDGWLDKNLLDTGVNQIKYIYKLRQALKPVPGVKIQGDGAGRYRLVLD